MTEIQKLYRMYERLLLAKAKELYPVPARYIFKIGNAEATHQISGHQPRVRYKEENIREILENIMAVLNGHCNVVGLTGIIGSNKINFIVGLETSNYNEITKL